MSQQNGCVAGLFVGLFGLLQLIAVFLTSCLPCLCVLIVIAAAIKVLLS